MTGAQELLWQSVPQTIVCAARFPDAVSWSCVTRRLSASVDCPRSPYMHRRSPHDGVGVARSPDHRVCALGAPDNRLGFFGSPHDGVGVARARRGRPHALDAPLPLQSDPPHACHQTTFKAPPLAVNMLAPSANSPSTESSGHQGQSPTRLARRPASRHAPCDVLPPCVDGRHDSPAPK